MQEQLSQEQLENILNKIPENKFIPAKFIFYLYKYLWYSDKNCEELIENFINEL